MAYANVLVLDRAQAKIEGTRGTAESTMTRWLVYPNGRLTWTYEAEEGITPETLRSFHATDNDSISVGISRSRINLETYFCYDEGIWYLQSALDGNNRTGSAVGSTPETYTYTLTPSSATDDLDTFSLKAGDGSVAYKFDRCVINRITLRANPAMGGDQYWMASMEIFCRFRGTTSFDSPSDISRKKIVAKGTKLYIDTLGGTAGSTQITGRLRSFSLTIDNQIEEKIFMEDTDYVSGDFARGEQLITWEMALEHTSDDQAAIARAGTAQIFRILKEGDTIGATPTTKDTLRITMPVGRYIPRLAPSFQGQNRIMTMSGRALRNSSNAVPIEFYFTNLKSSITA
jgi:hypothetical protein